MRHFVTDMGRQTHIEWTDATWGPWHVILSELTDGLLSSMCWAPPGGWRYWVHSICEFGCQS